jgi:hypothetical protein
MADNLTNRPRWSIAPYFIVDDVVATVEGSWPKYSASMGPRDRVHSFGRTKRACPRVRRAMPPPGKKASRSQVADRDLEGRKGCQAR